MPIRIQGLLFNGREAKGHPALLVIDEGRSYFEEPLEMRLESYRLTDFSISDKIGNLPRVIEVQKQFRLETTDHANVVAFEKLLNRKQTVHQLESSWKIAGSMALALIVFIFVLYKYIIPAASYHLARMTPPKVVDEISKPVEKLLSLNDEEDPESILSEEEFQRTQKAIQDLRELFPKTDIHVKVVDMEDTPNAFVLPNGKIFLTAELVRISESSDELLAVLLHEMGHHHHYHALQGLIENSFLSALIITISGGTEWTNVPILVLGNQYSQENELQADEFSVTKFKKLGKDQMALATIFEKLEKSMDSKSSHKIPDFLSTHPSFKERIERIKNP